MPVHQISTGKILEGDIPVFVITFATQEMLLFRNVKTGEVVVGAENKVEQCHYAAVVTRVEEELDNELTGGWKVVEVRLFFAHLNLALSSYADGTEVVPRIPINATKVTAFISYYTCHVLCILLSPHRSAFEHTEHHLVVRHVS